jgi:hypothetical protein
MRGADIAARVVTHDPWHQNFAHFELRAKAIMDFEGPHYGPLRYGSAAPTTVLSKGRTA